MDLERQILTRFIEKYRQYPCLWEIKNSSYHDKNKKNEAYGILALILNELQPTAGIKEVKAKIASMKNSFTKEHRKVQASIHSGMGTDEVYKPTLWYYDLLLFTRDEEGRPSSSIEHILDGYEDNAVGSPISYLQPTTLTPTRLPNVSTPTPKRKYKPDDLLKIIAEQLQKPAPAPPAVSMFENFGQYVATKLSQLEPMQNTIAQKLITDVLFGAELNLLKPDASINAGGNPKIVYCEEELPQ